MRVRLKICGITRVQDALAASDLGVDALGLVFHPESPRHISIEQAQAIISTLPPFISKVALFCNASKEIIEQVLTQLNIDCLQFHGDESEEFCLQFKRSYIKAIRVKTNADLTTQLNCYPSASAILLDSFNSSSYGGTGKRFDWQLIPQVAQQKLIIAGGINPHNIVSLLERVQPYAVDVSSGVELQAGIKDTKKISQLIQKINLI
jgi:phosphoribosylanthranilate isomerase